MSVSEIWEITCPLPYLDLLVAVVNSLLTDMCP